MSIADPSEVAALLKSGDFDSNWYIRRYPDVVVTGMDPIEHYIWLGKRLGRRAKPAKPEDDVIDLQVVRSASKEIPDAPEIAQDLDRMIATLAKWEGLEADYVCYQLGVSRVFEPLRVAKMYYESIKKRNIFPNPLFDPEYYKFANGLKFREDPVFHFLTEGREKHLPTHRLFDHDWYLDKCPSARQSDDMILHYWNKGYKKRISPINTSDIAVVDLIEKIFFAESDPVDVDYDDQFYREFYPDLDHFGEEARAEHYRNHGREEGRLGSIPVLLKQFNLSGHYLPINFDPQQYMSLHIDLQETFSDNQWGALIHYIDGGLSEGRIYSYAQMSGFVSPVPYTLDEDKLKSSADKIPLCVLVHLYYPEMWNELEAYISNIDVEFDIRVNLVESTWSSSTINAIRSKYPNAIVIISPNEGRDIGGFFSLLKNVDFQKYVAFTMLHSKKSPHVTRDYASLWKKNLLGAILGSKDLIRENLAAFLEDSEIGIIGSVGSRHAGIEGNEEGMKKLFEIYGISKENQDCEYVSGTMMMVRSEVMKEVYAPLRSHQFVNGDDKSIDHHIDGQVEHSVERIFGNVMKQLGYRFLWR